MSTIWKENTPLVLASTSVTRLQLLQAAALPVDVYSPTVDERALEASIRKRNGDPDYIALELAKAKAADVSRRVPDRLVVAADQTLALGSEQFHKPIDSDAAREQLLRLAGKTHALHSAVVCFRNGQQLFTHVETARLTMRALSPAFLDVYLNAAGSAVSRSVGGYQLERLGVHLFDRVEGDQSTILGLPMLPLLAFLRQVGAVEA